MSWECTDRLQQECSLNRLLPNPITAARVCHTDELIQSNQPWTLMTKISGWIKQHLVLLGATMMERPWTTVQGIRLDFSQAHFWRVTGSESVGWMWGVKICSKVFLSETLEQGSKIKLVFISKSVRSESGFLTVHDPHSNPDASIERTSSGSTRCCSEGKRVSGATGRSSL